MCERDGKVHSLSSSGKVAATPHPKIRQSCSDPHPNLRPITIFTFYSLNYSLAARLQDYSRPKLPAKVETKRKLQQVTVSERLVMKGGESSSEKKKTYLKAKTTINMKSQYN